MENSSQEKDLINMMEQQMVKLSEIVMKKEKEITNLQMIIQDECQERCVAVVLCCRCCGCSYSFFLGRN